VRGDAQARDALSPPHGYGERGAVAGCVRLRQPLKGLST